MPVEMVQIEISQAVGGRVLGKPVVDVDQNLVGRSPLQRACARDGLKVVKLVTKFGYTLPSVARASPGQASVIPCGSPANSAAQALLAQLNSSMAAAAVDFSS